MKIYTKTGDDGSTGLLGNLRVRKNAARIEACGTVDELNAALGVVVTHLPSSAHIAEGWLEAVQNDLFAVGALLSTPPSLSSRPPQAASPQAELGETPPKSRGGVESGGRATPPQETRQFATLSPQRVESLEQTIDQMEKTLQPLKHFILPKGAPAASFLHLARAICRRAERRVVSLADQEKVSPLLVTYLNRLSDFLFVLARWVNKLEGGKETAWLNPEGVSAQEAGPDILMTSLQKLEEEKKRRQTLFEKTATDLQKKKEQVEKSFRQGVDQIKKEGGKVDPTLRPIDLD